MRQKMDYLQEIIVLKELLDAGAISNEEYECKKAEILGRQNFGRTSGSARNFGQAYDSDQSHGSLNPDAGNPGNSDAQNGQQNGQSYGQQSNQSGYGQQQSTQSGYGNQSTQSGYGNQSTQSGYGQHSNQQNHGQQQQYYQQQFVDNRKSRLAAGLLGIFLGSFGVHNFYLGFTGKAVAQLLLSVLGWIIVIGPVAAGIWGLVEGILILTASPSYQFDAKGISLRE
jgi:TM2 domain-containing membrane protein YozV